jgi:WD40 repeat protein
VRTLAQHAGPVVDLDFSRDGARLATTSRDGTVKLWDLGTWTAVTLEVDPFGAAAASAFSPDGTRVVTMPGWADGPRVWEVATGTLLAALPGRGWANTAVAFIPDGSAFVSAAGDGTFTIWDSVTYEPVLVHRAHRDTTNWLDVGPDGRIVTGGNDGVVKVWEIAEGGVGEVLSLAGHGAFLNCVAFGPRGERVASVAEDGTARVWDITAAGSRELFTAAGAAPGGLAFGPDGERLIASRADGTAVIFDVVAASATVELPHGALVLVTDVSGDGATIATGGFDGVVRLWDAATGEPRAVIPHEGHDWVTAVALDEDGTRVASAGYHWMLAEDESWEYGSVRLWDTVTEQLVDEWWTDGANGFYTLAFNRDVDVLAGHDMYGGATHVWDLVDGMTTVVDHPPNFYWIPGSVDLSPDAATLLVVYDSMVATYDTATGARLVTFAGHDANIEMARFSSDGASVVTGSADATVKIWDAATGAERLTLRGHGSGVVAVAIDSTGQYVASLSEDSLRVWILDVDELVALARSRLTRGFTTDECRTYLHIEACPPD